MKTSSQYRLTLKPDIHDKAANEAKKLDMSFSAFIALVIQKFVERHSN